MESLIRRAQQGDEMAFEQLLNSCYDRIFCYALKWSGDRADAEDITHKACMKLARGIQQFRFESAFSSWLYRLVINCAKDWEKAQSRHHHELIDDYPDAMVIAQDNQAEVQLQLRQIFKQLETMGQGFKETVILVHGEGLSHQQAAEILEVKESTISWRIHQVRKCLEPQFGGRERNA